MRIVAWNLNHRIREKPIPLEALRGIQSLAPDILVLNEFVDGKSRLPFKADLSASGFVHQAISPTHRGKIRS